MTETWVDATASAVTHKELTAKSSGRKFTLYTVETDRGDFTTAKRELAEQSHRLVGQPARFLVKTEQRGEFTNYYLETVEARTNGQSAIGSAAFPPAPAQTGTFDQPMAPPAAPQAPVGVPAGPDSRDVFIFRQTAAKVAGQISKTPDEFWTNLDDLVHYFSTGLRPGLPPDTSGGFQSDDDIPF